MCRTDTQTNRETKILCKHKEKDILKLIKSERIPGTEWIVLKIMVVDYTITVFYFILIQVFVKVCDIGGGALGSDIKHSR